MVRPYSVAAGDFNGDGKRDLAVASDANSVSILLGNGNGTFQAAVNYAAGSNPETHPHSLAVGDFNGDAKQDLAVANSGSNNVSILLGNGDGTFQAAVNYGMTGVAQTPVAVAVGEFHGDAKQDLAVVTTQGFTNYVLILRGNGDGTFQAGGAFPVAMAPSAVAVADFDGDGKRDLAVATKFSTVSILLGNGDGSFQAAVDYAVGALSYSLAVGDVNGDAKLDLAVANFNSNNVSILLGNGNGTFQVAVNYGAGTNPTSVALGDFNGDAKQDLAVANETSDNVSVLLGNGNGTFQPAVDSGSGTSPDSVAVGDFDGDGKQDLGVANKGSDNVSILLGNGNGTFRGAAVNYGVAARPVSVAVGDFNGDAKPDLAVANSFSDNVSVLLGHGNGTFQRAVNYAVGRLPVSVAWGDFNGDSKQDLAVANSGSTSNNVSILLGNGNGTFQAAVDYAAGSSPNSVAVGDFNGDAKQDLAFASGSNASILLGNGDGTFQAPVNYGGGAGSPVSVAVGDFNGDAKQDLAVASQGLSNNVSILLGNGNGTFQAAVNYTAGTNNNPYSVAVGDFNGDAKQDLAVANPSGTPTVSILLGNGNGTFQAAVDYAGGGSSVAVGDLNGDGKQDLAITNLAIANGGVSVLLGNGDGTLQAAVNYAVGSDPNSLAVGDFDADSDQDLAVANSLSNSVSILLNTCVTPTIVVSSSANPSSSGQTVTFTATLTSPAGGTPTGTVTFKDGTTTLGTGTLSAGTATFTTSTLTGGSHSITAVYAGDSSFCGSTSAALIQTVTTLAGTTTSVSSSTNPSSAGQSVTFTAMVSSNPTPGGPPTGTVTFKDGTTTLGTGTLSGIPGSISISSASFTTSTLTAAIHSITAVYAGDSIFSGSTSAALTQTVFQTTPPTVSINDVSVTEGNSGTTNAVFTVALSAPFGQVVSVNFATNDGTASGSTDFTPNSGSLTFNPGDVTANVSVSISGDTTPEPDETYSVVLSAPLNATLAKATGVGVIADDDGSASGPRVFVYDRAVAEGSATGASFRVDVSPASAQDVTVNYATAPGTATAGSDYTHVSGSLTFTPGRNAHSVVVPVLTDAIIEGSESFYFNITSVAGATILDGQAVGTISDPPTAADVPMYRAYNPNAFYHFFTTSLGEFTNAVAAGYRDESNPPCCAIPFMVPNLEGTGKAGIFRMYNPNNGRHYYTANSAERDILMGIGWVYEKDEGFIYASQQPSTVEVFKLYNNIAGVHLYTVRPEEKDAILQQFPGIWFQHTSLGFAVP